MILFIFEGNKREPDLFKTLNYLFFPKGQTIVCSFGNNIYELYRQLNNLDDAGDVVSLLIDKERNNPDSPFPRGTASSDFSEVYLFFDYDFQNKNLTLEQMNSQIAEMLDMFDDETDNGKLYINYPMVEAIRYTKQIPDPQFVNYTASRSDCYNDGFKDLTQKFSDYGSLDFIVLDFRKELSKERYLQVRDNWELLKIQTVSNANYLCNQQDGMPIDKESISQKKLFQVQLNQFIVPHDAVSIISAIPLFHFEYFKH